MFIDFGKDVVLIPSRSHTQPAKPSKIFVFYNEFEWCNPSGRTDFNDFHDICRYLFWHFFLMVVCTDVGSILEYCWYHFPCFFAIILFLYIICWMVFYWFNAISDPKKEPKASTAGLSASGLSPRISCSLVSLNQVKNSSAIWKVFLISKFPSRFPCALVSLAFVKPTSVLWPEKRKFIVARLWILKAPRLRFGSNCVYLGIILCHFCFFQHLWPFRNRFCIDFAKNWKTSISGKMNCWHFGNYKC